MNNSRVVLLLLSFLCFTWLRAQTGTLTQLHFPYQNGYEFTMTDTSVEYDQYNFPVKQTVHDIKYTVKDNPAKKGNLIFQLNIIDKETDKLLNSRNSYLEWGKKGMSWWMDKSKDDDGKPTQAIKLPMKVGTSWKSMFSGYKSVMTCIATDTTLQTMYGPISCFGVSYTIVMKDESAYKYYMVVKEFYNVYAGKVHTEDVTYLLTKSDNKTAIVNKSWGNITYSVISDEQRDKIVKK